MSRPTWMLAQWCPHTVLQAPAPSLALTGLSPQPCTACAPAAWFSPRGAHACCSVLPQLLPAGCCAVAMVIFENVNGCWFPSSLQATASCGRPLGCQADREPSEGPKALESRLTLDLWWGLPGLRAKNVGQVAKQRPWGLGQRAVSSKQQLGTGCLGHLGCPRGLQGRLLSSLTVC